MEMMEERNGPFKGRRLFCYLLLRGCRRLRLLPLRFFLCAECPARLLTSLFRAELVTGSVEKHVDSKQDPVPSFHRAVLVSRWVVYEFPSRISQI